MRTRYVHAMARERAAWREFVATSAVAPDARDAYDRWQAAAAQTRELAARLQDAGLRPPDGPLASSPSLGRGDLGCTAACVEAGWIDIEAERPGAAHSVKPPGETRPN